MGDFVSLTNSLLISAFGFLIVFVILVSLSLIIRVQSFLISKIAKLKKGGN